MNKKELKENYNDACNDYLSALLEKWELTGYHYWIAEEIGGVCNLPDDNVIYMQDIIYCYENDVSYGEYSEWLDYNVAAREFNFDRINLKSWHKGCPRVSADVLDRLRQMKSNLDEECRRVKEELKKGNDKALF